MPVADLVGEIEGVRRRTRRASYGAAVPLALLGLLVLLAAPFYAMAVDSVFSSGGSGTSGVVDTAADWRPPSFLDKLLRVNANLAHHKGVGVFWLVAAPLTFAAIAAYYRRRAHRTGLSVDGWRVALTGAVAFGSLVATMYAGGAATAPTMGELAPGNVLNPFLVVALGVFAVAWVERSVVAALAGVTFTAALLLFDVVTYARLMDTGWGSLGSWGWATVLLGAVLLLWAGVAAVVQRVRA